MIGGSQWEHGGGFSIDAAVFITAADGAGRERLLRYCARPPFALQRLRELDAEHLPYERARSGPDGSGPLRLTPLQLLDRLAVLVLPLRTAVTAMALPVSTSPRPRCRSVRFRSFLRPLRVDRHVNNGSVVRVGGRDRNDRSGTFTRPSVAGRELGDCLEAAPEHALAVERHL